MKIAFIDSGFGGLIFMKDFFDQNLEKVQKLIQKYNSSLEAIHYADTKNMPYGMKTKEELKKIVHNIITKAIEDGNKVIVIACNTGSTVLDDEIINDYKKNFDVDVIEIIKRSSEYISEITPCKDGFKNIAILGTKATIGSNMYAEKIRNIDSKTNVFSYSPVNWEHKIESGIIESEKQIIVDESLTDFEKKFSTNDYNIFEKISSIGLYCTHYTFLIDEIVNFLKNKTKNWKNIHLVRQGIIFDEIIISSLEKYLQKEENRKSGDIKIFSISNSDNNENPMKKIYQTMYKNCNLNIKF